MAYDDDEIRRLLKKERSRGRKHPGPDPDVEADKKTREEMVRELLKLETEAEFIQEFKRAMSGYGLPIGPDQIQRALQIWKAHHHK
jgi:hypothetical protein